MSFKTRIISIRRQNDLEQPKFAERIGVSIGAIQKYESGRSIPNGKILQRIRQEFGVDLTWLLTGEGVPYYKGMDEGFRAAESEFPFAETRRHEVDGTNYTVQEFKPKGAWVPPDLPREDPFVRGVGALRTIFDSGDPLLISAIQSNLTAFEQAAIKDRHLREQSKRIQKLEDDCEAFKKEISDLRILIEAGDAGAGKAKTGTDTA